MVVASAVFTIENTGVMPLPAPNATTSPVRSARQN